MHKQQSVIFAIAVLVLSDFRRPIGHASAAAKFDRFVGEPVLHEADNGSGFGVVVFRTGRAFFRQIADNFVRHCTLTLPSPRERG